MGRYLFWVNTKYWASFSPDGQRVVTASQDTTARIWSIRNSEGATVLRGHTAAVNTAEFSPDGTRVVTASNDKTARVWLVPHNVPSLEVPDMSLNPLENLVREARKRVSRELTHEELEEFLLVPAQAMRSG